MNWSHSPALMIVFMLFYTCHHGNACDNFSNLFILHLPLKDDMLKGINNMLQSPQCKLSRLGVLVSVRSLRMILVFGSRIASCEGVIYPKKRG